MPTFRLAVLFLCAAVLCSVEPDQPLLFESPTVSRTEIAFTFADDLWMVGREGGEARRLTKGAILPRFSPDGTEIAFTGGPSDNGDVYILAAAGGIPRRLTWHPNGSYVEGWTPDGKSVLFSSDRYSPVGHYRLFTISRDGGRAIELPLDPAVSGSFSPDQTRMAYAPFSPPSYWRGYRGGGTGRVWIADLRDSRIERIPRDNSNDSSPMWVGQRIYFLSDRSGTVGLFAYDRAAKKVRQMERDAVWDIEWASAGPDAIVYVRGGSLYLFDLATRRSRRVDVRVPYDLPPRIPREANVGGKITGAALSPRGDTALFEARGDVFTVTAGAGETRNLTATPGVREFSPVWSPDGTRSAYFSDESGEYELHVRNADGSGEVKKIRLGGPSFYFSPVWSPDSTKIAFSDKSLHLSYVDVDRGKVVQIDSDTYQERYWLRAEMPPPSWSPDSRWVSYSKLLKNWLRAVYVYSLDSGRTRQVTDGMVDVRYPQFDRSGRYLYFAASKDLGPTIGDHMSAIGRMPTRTVHALVLRKGQPPPTGTAHRQSAELSSPVPWVQIDFEDVEDRIIRLPLPARNYVSLTAGEPGTIYLCESTTLDPEGLPRGRSPANTPLTLYKFDLGRKEAGRLEEGIRDLVVSADGTKLLYRRGETWVISSASVPTGPGEQRLDTTKMKVRIDPAAELRETFNEVWRFERDFFYDPHYRGLDLKATKARYEPFLQNIVTGRQLTRLFQMMLGEFSVSHIAAGGGGTFAAEDKPASAATGLLGADYQIESGRYRFSRVYHADPWEGDVRAPLAEPGLSVDAGEYLLAVDGRELHASDDVFSFFEGTADRPTMITVGPDPEGAGARTVTVVPTDSEAELRSAAWVEDNRRQVDLATGGRVAYVYLPNTAGLGKAAFARQFYAQSGKEAAIVDARFNSGGGLADEIIQRLTQPIWGYVKTRHGRIFSGPLASIPGPKVMIINESVFSGGDLLAYLFRRAGVGPLVGERTAGGTVGVGGVLRLMNGGIVAVPSNAYLTPEGRHVAEGEGIAPDIEVEQDPAAVRAGHDPQLEKAIEVVIAALGGHPLPKLTK